MKTISNEPYILKSDHVDMDFAISPLENWEHIVECKKKFIEEGIDPRQSPYIRPIVAESWITSHSLGINPKENKLGHTLSADQLQFVMEENQLLIEITRPLIETFISLATYSGYVLTLRDRNGIMLLQEGNTNEINAFHNCNSKIGTQWTESSVGTCAHVLCMRYKKPIQLLGPENYCYALQNNIISCAPILDTTGNLNGTLILALSNNVAEFDYDKISNKLQTHSLGWVSLMAVSIQQQLYLKQNYRILETTRNILEVSLEFNDEGIILIGHDGNIKHVNTTGLKILQHSLKELDGKTVFNLFYPNSTVIQAVKNGTCINYIEETLKINNLDQTYIVSTHPVFTNESPSTSSCTVIRLSSVDKINDLAIRRTGNSSKFSFDDIIGESPAIIKVKDMCKRFSTSPENILLLGENGTGKELFAQSIHTNSRPKGPFIAINCAAMPRNLIESELFGYEGGSFSGADRNGRPGKIELANGGTLFLDEIGEMPFEIQAVLLRVLEDKKVMRIGGKRYHDINFRLVAATNRDLYEMVEKKTFRADLFYRLSVLKIYIPALKIRENDPALLAHYFIENYSKRTNLPLPKISDETIAIIKNYDWPGNVRQLENAIIYAVNMNTSDTINPEHLPEEIACNTKFVITKSELNTAPQSNLSEISSLQEAELLLIQNALNRANYNVIQAATILKISKSTLYRKLKEYNISL